jgi:hypothetical protein
MFDTCQEVDIEEVWWGEWWDSNPQPLGPQPRALTN